LSAYRVEQRRVSHRGREWHFVSYEGIVEKKTGVEHPPMWYLMASGKRWEVMEQVRGQDAVELDRMFVKWLDRTIFA
jgi:hypothetical protein